jgi:small subunit ribosomal protein S15
MTKSTTTTATPQVGTSEGQITSLTGRINEITGHLKTHPKDNHTRRGLIVLVGKRKKLLTYLKRKNGESYVSLISVLGLRK